MDLIKKFLSENAYKFPKGYPDLSQEEDKQIMEKLLNNLGIDLNDPGPPPNTPNNLGPTGNVGPSCNPGKEEKSELS